MTELLVFSPLKLITFTIKLNCVLLINYVNQGVDDGLDTPGSA